MATQYILQDRTTATKWALKVSNAQLLFEETTDTAQDEPIFVDRINLGTYWKLYIDDGQLATESTSILQNDIIILIDASTDNLYRLLVSEAQFAIELIEQSHGSNVFRVIRPNRNIRVVSYSNQYKIIKNTVYKKVSELDTSLFRYNQTPVESPNGVLVVFTLPNNDSFISGLIEVFVNGNQKIKNVEWQETGTTQITFIGSLATTPPASDEVIRLNYIKSS